MCTENLLGLRADADGTQELVNESKDEAESAQLDPATLTKLEDLGESF